MIRLAGILLGAVCFCSVPLAHSSPDWENEQILHRNRLPARANFWPMGSCQEAIANQRDRSPWIQALNGNWHFNWTPSPDDAPQDFFQESFDTRNWPTLPVPSNWQLHGYGTPIYKSSGYTFRTSIRHE